MCNERTFYMKILGQCNGLTNDLVHRNQVHRSQCTTVMPYVLYMRYMYKTQKKSKVVRGLIKYLHRLL